MCTSFGVAPPQPGLGVAGTAQEGVKARLTWFSSQDAHLQTIIEVLQSIKASDMTPLLKRIYESPGGSDCLDVLMKYMYDKPIPCNPSPKKIK